MFEKLQEISKVIVVPTAMLYFLGFVCVTSFLSRFGIITFEIVNARYLIAGIHALLATAAAIVIARYLYTNALVHGSRIFTLELTPERFFAYISYIVLTAIGALALNYVFALGGYEPPVSASVIRFYPLGDPIGNLLARWEFGGATELEFVVKYIILSLAYLAIAAALLTIISFLWKMLAGLLKRKPTAKPTVRDSHEEGAPIVVDRRIDRRTMSNNSRARFIIRLIDIACVLIGAILTAFAFIKVRTALFDITSFQTLVVPSWALISSWLYLTILAMLLFMIVPAWSNTSSQASLFTRLSDPGIIFDATQRLAIPMLASILLFGTTIFPRIPLAIGGGQPREVRVIFQNGTPTTSDTRTFLIGENSQFFFVVEISSTQSRAFQLNKAAVLRLETRNVTASKKPSAQP
ncbi:MAG: hypothetical protein HOP13_15990 [Alphaproteobacteria bacterium]|nr:hypothetical protein [Alphaproteobacteria bacterium]